MARAPGAHEYATAEVRSKGFGITPEGRVYRMVGRSLVPPSDADYAFIGEWPVLFTEPMVKAAELALDESVTNEAQ
jgi:hypothetical protein